LNGNEEARLERMVQLRAEMVDLLLDVSTSADTLNLRRAHVLKHVARIDAVVIGMFCAVSVALLIAPWFGSTANWYAVLIWLCVLTGSIVSMFFRNHIHALTR
jgi:hypothetical protein